MLQSSSSSTTVVVNTTDAVSTDAVSTGTNTPFTNMYTVGDNISLLKGISNESIDMIYMDPPYNTGRNFYYFQDKFGESKRFSFSYESAYDDLLDEVKKSMQESDMINLVDVYQEVMSDFKLLRKSNLDNLLNWSKSVFKWVIVYTYIIII